MESEHVMSQAAQAKSNCYRRKPSVAIGSFRRFFFFPLLASAKRRQKKRKKKKQKKRKNREQKRRKKHENIFHSFLSMKFIVHHPLINHVRTTTSYTSFQLFNMSSTKGISQVIRQGKWPTTKQKGILATESQGTFQATMKNHTLRASLRNATHLQPNLHQYQSQV